MTKNFRIFVQQTYYFVTTIMNQPTNFRSSVVMIHTNFFIRVDFLAGARQDLIYVFFVSLYFPSRSKIN